MEGKGCYTLGDQTAGRLIIGGVTDCVGASDGPRAVAHESHALCGAQRVGYPTLHSMMPLVVWLTIHFLTVAKYWYWSFRTLGALNWCDHYCRISHMRACRSGAFTGTLQNACV